MWHYVRCIHDSLSTFPHLHSLRILFHISQFSSIAVWDLGSQFHESTNCHISFKFLRDIIFRVIFCRANFQNTFSNITIILDFSMFLVSYHYNTRHQPSNKAFFSSLNDSNLHFTSTIKFSTRENENLK